MNLAHSWEKRERERRRETERDGERERERTRTRKQTQRERGRERERDSNRAVAIRRLRRSFQRPRRTKSWRTRTSNSRTPRRSLTGPGRSSGSGVTSGLGSKPTVTTGRRRTFFARCFVLARLHPKGQPTAASERQLALDSRRLDLKQLGARQKRENTCTHKT